MSDDIEMVLREVELKASEISEKNGMSCNSMIEISEARGNLNIFISFNEDGENGKINETDQSHEEYLKLFKDKLEKRRSPRSESELNNSDKPASAEENKLHVKYQARVSPEYNSLVDDFKNKTGLSKREITERALARFIASYPSLEDLS